MCWFIYLLCSFAGSLFYFGLLLEMGSIWSYKSIGSDIDVTHLSHIRLNRVNPLTDPGSSPKLLLDHEPAVGSMRRVTDPDSIPHLPMNTQKRSARTVCDWRPPHTAQTQTNSQLPLSDHSVASCLTCSAERLHWTHRFKVLPTPR